MATAFGHSMIKAGTTASTDVPGSMASILGAEEGVTEIADGYIAPLAGCIKVKGKKVYGVSTSAGFFYSKSLGEEVEKVMEDLVSRGMAYANGK